MISPISRRQILSTSKVLIVDDSRSNRAILSEICAQNGLSNIKEAADGEEGLNLAIQYQPDVIFLDINMPKMNGIEVCSALRESKHDAVIIMHTAQDESEFKAKAFDAGVTDFISHPFNGREVVARVHSHLERRRYKQKIETDFQRLSDELKEAVMLQTLLTPDDKQLQFIREQAKLDIAYYYHPSTELGGDYVSILPVSSTKTALIMADVAGHGVTAALYTFVIHSLLQDASAHAFEPASVLGMLNSKLHRLLLNGKFVTLFFAVVDTQEETLSFSSAGSPQPIMLSEDKFHLLDSSGIPLGVQNSATYHTQKMPFKSGDMVCVYSDAFIETSAKNGNFLSEKHLIDMMEKAMPANATTTMKALLSGFFIQCGNNPPDDLTLLICRR